MRHHHLVVFVFSILAVATWSCSTVGASPRKTPNSAKGISARLPPVKTRAKPPHIMLIVMENQGFSNIIGNQSSPYVNNLARHYLTATNDFARAHPSLPNYLELISGHAYLSAGTSTDCAPNACGPITGTTLADQLQKAHVPWRAYLGSMPRPCDTQNAGGSGGYGVRHNPFVYFPQARRGVLCHNIVPASSLLANLNAKSTPDFVFFAPNICNDGGNDVPCSTLQNGDRYLSKFIPSVMRSHWFRSAGTIILTWDEGTSTSGRAPDFGGQVPTVVISNSLRDHRLDNSYVDTAGILRTIERAYGLVYLGRAALTQSGVLPLGN